MILIYAHITSSRLQYTCSILFKTILGIPFRITTHEPEFLEYEGPKLCYGDLETTEFAIKPHSLLFDTGIRPYKLYGEPIFGDPLAEAFYVATRYEEYLPFEPDEHGRFEAKNSILFLKGLLKVPYVHQLAELIFKEIKQRHPQLRANYSKYKPQVLIDIDQAYSFRGKGITWSAYITLKNLLSGKLENVTQQWKVLLGISKDPYDSYSFLEKKQQQSGIEFLYFIHCGDWGRFDRTLPVKLKEVKNLIRKISGYTQIGIHPSYYSNQDRKMLKKEITRLKEIIGKEVYISRQHYLRLFMPVSYKMLISENILEDYSMGYATEEGFRSGMCIPYNWYNLEEDQETPLIIYPVTFMEGTFGEDKNNSPIQAWEEIEQLMDTVRRYHGKFISAWHNHTLTDHAYWKGWKLVFEKMLDKLSD